MKSMAKVVVAVVVLVLTGPSAWAGLSGSTTSDSGSTCSGGGSTDGDCRHSVSEITNNSTTYKTRYAWNINADTTIFNTHDTSGNAQHNISFTATAPGGYRLDITENRVGDMGLNNDASGCSGSADTSGVTGSSNITPNSGNLNLADPGVINTTGTTQDIPFNQTTTATIFRVSNGVGQSHTLTFTWNGSVRSNSCEAEVREGESSGTTSGCTSCGYPGSPSRTQASDGNFVTVTFTSLCGNGSIDSSVGEQCDAGSANGVFGTCCDANCHFTANGTTCRNSAGACDVTEACTGNSPTCPTDGFASNTVVCRSSAGVCDIAETCPGNGPNCPADAKSTAVCRSSAGACDVAESCNG